MGFEMQTGYQVDRALLGIGNAELQLKRLVVDRDVDLGLTDLFRDR